MKRIELTWPMLNERFPDLAPGVYGILDNIHTSRPMDFNSTRMLSETSVGNRLIIMLAYSLPMYWAHVQPGIVIEVPDEQEEAAFFDVLQQMQNTLKQAIGEHFELVRAMYEEAAKYTSEQKPWMWAAADAGVAERGSDQYEQALKKYMDDNNQTTH